jgi:hypothetical protein
MTRRRAMGEDLEEMLSCPIIHGNQAQQHVSPQGNRVLSRQYPQEVLRVESGLESLAPYSAFRCFLLLQQVQGQLAYNS